MPNTHIVQRQIGSGDDKIPAGTEVDATDWLHRELLLKQGYIVPITDETVLPLQGLETAEVAEQPEVIPEQQDEKIAA